MPKYYIDCCKTLITSATDVYEAVDKFVFNAFPNEVLSEFIRLSQKGFGVHKDDTLVRTADAFRIRGIILELESLIPYSFAVEPSEDIDY